MATQPVALRVYGFDPGTKYGWSVWDGPDQCIASGVWKTFGGTEHPGRRFQRARQKLLHLFTKYPPVAAVNIVGYEDVHVGVFRDKNNLRVYTGLVASLFEAAAVAGLSDIRGITPASLKKHATGSGATRGKNAVSKEMICDQCIKQFSIVPETDDHADALFVGHYFAENPCPPTPKPKKKQSTATSRTSKRGTPSTRTSSSSGRARSKKTGRR